MLNFVSTVSCIRQLVEISRFYGENKDFVFAAGGNTSFKDEKFMWIKASGTSLANMSDENLVVLDRAKLQTLKTRKYSNYSGDREKQIKNDLFRACVYPERNQHPSVETPLHEIIDYNYVVHTHPTFVNAVMCSVQAEAQVQQMFGEKALFVPYDDPGYMLFKKVTSLISLYREAHQRDPNIIFIQNHGIFVAANSIDDIKQIYSEIFSTIQAKIKSKADTDPSPLDGKITQIVPAIRMMLTEQSPKTLIIRNHSLLQKYSENQEQFSKIALPLNPDVVQYCNSKAVFIENTGTPSDILSETTEKIDAFKRIYKSCPKILIIKNLGIISVGNNYYSAKTALDVFEDQIKIAFYAENFGGTRAMGDREVSFINSLSMDNMQRLLQKQKTTEGKVADKTIVILNGSMDIFAEITENLLIENANVVVTGENEIKGNEFVTALNAKAKDNQAIFITTNLIDNKSVKRVLYETIQNFGGLDSFIIVQPLIDKGFQVDVHEIAEILRLQASYKKAYFTDIIEIKAQPGLDSLVSIDNNSVLGQSNTELKSIALQLLHYSIKVNSIQPGNIFKSTVWNDPETGLFKKSLESGLIPDAKNIEDLKSFYESRLPAGRSCEIKDIMRALYYLIEQEYETGQTIDVTGGSNIRL